MNQDTKSYNVPVNEKKTSNMAIFFWVGSIVAILLILTFVFIGNETKNGRVGNDTTTDQNPNTETESPAH